MSLLIINAYYICEEIYSKNKTIKSNFLYSSFATKNGLKTLNNTTHKPK